MKPARIAEIVDTLGDESEPDACWWVDAVTELMAERSTYAETIRLLRSERDALLARIAELEARPTVLVAHTISGTVKM